VLATGDRVFNRIVPVIDLDGGVDVESWAASLRNRFGIEARDFTVVPGHGAVGGPELLSEQARYLDDLVAAVAAADIVDEPALAVAKSGFTMPRYADYEATFGDHAGNFEAIWRLNARGNHPPVP
jgi:glyoxylase-like metal-dependent hydrolase (beta-lactamase superfamily II)